MIYVTLYIMINLGVTLVLTVIALWENERFVSFIFGGHTLLSVAVLVYHLLG